MRDAGPRGSRGGGAQTEVPGWGAEGRLGKQWGTDRGLPGVGARGRSRVGRGFGSWAELRRGSWGGGAQAPGAEGAVRGQGRGRCSGLRAGAGAGAGARPGRGRRAAGRQGHGVHGGGDCGLAHGGHECEPASGRPGGGSASATPRR